MATVVVFSVGNQKLAMPVMLVERIVWAVEITALPQRQDQTNKLEGIINVEGTIIPVFDFRRLLLGQIQDLSLHDQFMIISCREGLIALIVDSVEGVLDHEESDLTPMDRPEGSYACGVLKREEDLVAVIEPQAFAEQVDLRHFFKNQRQLIGVG